MSPSAFFLWLLREYILDEERRLNLQFFAGDEDKTEEATPHRRREARKKGQVMKSTEMNAAVGMAGMVFFFVLYWRYFLNGFTSLMRHSIDQLRGDSFEMFSFDYLSRFVLEQFLLLAAPFLLTALLLGFLSNVLQVGFLVSSETIKPQGKRINPLEGFKRIFSTRALFEMVKSILKVSIVGTVSYLYLRAQLPEMLLLFAQEPGMFVSVLVSVLRGLALWVAAVFMFISLLDYIYQRYEFQKSQRMSKKEVKDEFKNLEGDPHVRARQRERQRAIAQQRSLADVPEATVVIINPTEYAVALRFIEKEDQAPVLVAKGAGRMALRIREVASENNIPIIEDPPVARLLFAQVELGQEVPQDLYQAVAEILALVYRLQEKERKRRPARA
ncbi:MAG: flagellar biosynthesis protein FlhB [Bacillota bacterium]|nr:flagellar biosynthesis protein FlhB [Bacillota bacterium]